MTTDEIYAKLKLLAPSVHFGASRTWDEHFTWDGDGPDPILDGLLPYDVDITATTIIAGEIIEVTASLGGCYMASDEPIGDIGGYLPQKLEEAAENLLKQIKAKDAFRYSYATEHQLAQVLAFLTQLMHDRYQEQRRQIDIAERKAKGFHIPPE